METTLAITQKVISISAEIIAIRGLYDYVIIVTDLWWLTLGVLLGVKPHTEHLDVWNDCNNEVLVFYLFIL